MTDEETRNSQYWEERSEELSNDELKGVSGGLSQILGRDCSSPSFTRTQDDNPPKGSGSGKTTEDWLKSKEGKWTGPEQVH